MMSVFEYSYLPNEQDADWPKATADFLNTPAGPITNVDDLRIALDAAGWSTVEFKKLPAYTAALADHPWLSDL